MTDLISLSDIQSQLQANAETFVELNTAYYVAQQMQAKYEADRAASAQRAADLEAHINALGNELYADGATITDLQSANSAMSGTVTSLQTQVVALTQVNASLDAANTTLSAQVASLTPDVTVTIGNQIATSAFSTAVSHVSTNDLMLGDATARARAEAALAPALTYHRVSCHSFGAGDPWLWNGTGTRPVDPTNWATLDSLVAMAQRMAGTPIMGFGNWPWHVRGRWDGTTTVPCTYADLLKSEGRPITERLPDVLHFVECVCKRYMVAPYNVRFWQLGGWEFHGFDRDRAGGFTNWGFDAYAGSPGQADMGMAYLHNQVSAKIIAVAASLGITRSAIKIITNYPPMTARGVNDGSVVAVGHPLRDRPWGSARKAPIAALLGMLPLLTPGSFDYWSYDQTTYNNDGIARTSDDFVNVQRFTDFADYLKAQVAALGFGSVPFIVSEWYAKPQADPGAGSQQLRAALHADALRRFVLAGASTAITWSTVGRADGPGDETEGGLHSAVTTSTGGQPLPSLAVLKLFHDHFPPGTSVYDATIVGSGVSALASDKVAMLISKVSELRKVALGNDVYRLEPYEVRVVAL